MHQPFLVFSSFTGFLYFVLHVLSRIGLTNKYLARKLAQSPSNLHFLAFSVTLKQNIKQISCLQVPNLMLCVSTILYIWFRSKLDTRKLPTFLIGCFWKNFFEQKSALCLDIWIIIGSLMSKKKIWTIAVIIF